MYKESTTTAPRGSVIGASCRKSGGLYSDGNTVQAECPSLCCFVCLESVGDCGGQERQCDGACCSDGSSSNAWRKQTQHENNTVDASYPPSLCLTAIPVILASRRHLVKSKEQRQFTLFISLLAAGFATLNIITQPSVGTLGLCSSAPRAVFRPPVPWELPPVAEFFGHLKQSSCLLLAVQMRSDGSSRYYRPGSVSTSPVLFLRFSVSRGSCLAVLCANLRWVQG